MHHYKIRSPLLPCFFLAITIKHIGMRCNVGSSYKYVYMANVYTYIQQTILIKYITTLNLINKQSHTIGPNKN